MTWSYPTGFNVTDAITYANFVQQAYFQYYVLANTPPDFGYPAYNQVMVLPPAGYQVLYNIWYSELTSPPPVYFGYVAALTANPKQIVIAIRGTENANEWFDDIIYSDQVNSPIPNSSGLVHEGFSTIYNGENGKYSPGLVYYAPPPGVPPKPLTAPTSSDTPVPLSTVLQGAQSVMVTGHSLGAALSVLLTLDIALNIKVPVSCYNFASPMVGDPTFAGVFNALIGNKIGANYRVANGMDVVPNLPSNVFYNPAVPYFEKSQEWNYMQVNGYCPVDSGILSVVADPHSLSNYVIGLNNLNPAPAAVGPGQYRKAGLQSIPRWRDRSAELARRAA
jgi:triacylglycerol lipase